MYIHVFQNCTASSFGCKSGNIDCIDIDKSCDGAVDCTDGSDEDPQIAGCRPACNGAGKWMDNVLSDPLCYLIPRKPYHKKLYYPGYMPLISWIILYRMFHGEFYL
jgi:hypothetical protein